jgi:hypothetical protein
VVRADGEDRWVDMVGGYRLVRKLGSGERGEVFLGYAGSEGAVDASTAAVKIFRGSTDQQSISDEIGVLAGTSSPHLLRLLDVATGPDGRPCAILPRLSSVSLARLLADRPDLGAGEAVTILAPLCSAVRELHRSRACHGAIRSSSVLFDQRGAPVLARFGQASTFGNAEGTAAVTPAELAAEPRVAADLADLAALAELVLSRVSSADSTRSITELVSWLHLDDTHPAAERFARELAEQLFALAPAAPVDFAYPIVAGRGALPARMVTSEPVGELRAATGRMSSRHPASKPAPNPVAGPLSRLVLRVAAKAAAALPSVPIPITAERLARAKAAITSVRKPFWIAGAAGAVAIVVTLSLMPMSGGADAASGGAASKLVAAGKVTSQSTSQSASAPQPAASSSSATSPKQTGSGAAGADKAVIGADDPVAAGEALLRIREQCIKKRSVLCLEGADQANSSALENDGYLVRSLQGGGAAGQGASMSGAKLVLSERLGDSALLTVQGGESPAADGAALLIVKGESGWRIRDFLAN